MKYRHGRQKGRLTVETARIRKGMARRSDSRLNRIKDRLGRNYYDRGVNRELRNELYRIITGEVDRRCDLRDSRESARFTPRETHFIGGQLVERMMRRMDGKRLPDLTANEARLVNLVAGASFEDRSDIVRARHGLWRTPYVVSQQVRIKQKRANARKVESKSLSKRLKEYKAAKTIRLAWQREQKKIAKARKLARLVASKAGKPEDQVACGSSSYHNYSATLEELFGIYQADLRDGKRRFGIEIELNCRRGRRHIASFLNPVIENPAGKGKLRGPYAQLKYDGSISGLEIVSRPLQLSEHVNWWIKHGSDFRQACKQASATAGKNTGIHVHISRTYRNGECKEIEAKVLGIIKAGKSKSVFGREPNTWCRGVERQRGDGRYYAVNVTKHTAEIRMFNSTTVPQKIVEKIAIAAALAEG